MGALVALVASLGSVAAAQCEEADCEARDFQTTFSLPGDALGASVAIDGGVAVAGAPGGPFITGQEGAAYVFELQPSGEWLAVAKLANPSPAVGDEFGIAVDVRGDVILVGDYGADENGVDSGAAYLFTKPAGGWASPDSDADGVRDVPLLPSVTLLGTTIPGDPGSSPDNSGFQAGHSVALAPDGSAAYVGVPRWHDNHNFSHRRREGRVLVFPRPAGGWGDPSAPLTLTETVQLARAENADANGYTYQSGFTSLGTTLEVWTDASGRDRVYAGGTSDASANSGTAPGVWVFEEPALGWLDGATQSQVGDAIFPFVIIDATQVYVRADVPVQFAPVAMVGTDTIQNDSFGTALALLDGDIAAVGAPLAGNGPAVYVFARDAVGAWQQVSRLGACDGGGLGRSVAFTPDGSLYAGRPGVVYHYARDDAGTSTPTDDSWSPAGRTRPRLTVEHSRASNYEREREFGFALASSGTRVVIGKPAGYPGGQSERGIVYELPTDCACLTPPSGLSNWWPMDGTLDDVVGGEHGVPFGSPTIGSDIHVGDGLWFDVGDHIDAGPVAGNFGTGDFTAEAWFYGVPYGSNVHGVEFFHKFDGATGWRLDNHPFGSRLNFTAWNGGATVTLAADGGQLGFGNGYQWNHFAVTRRALTATQARYSLYWNGVLVDERDDLLFDVSSGANLRMLSTPTTIASQIGALDEAALHARALSQEEIRDVVFAYRAGRCKVSLPPPPVCVKSSGPVHWWTGDRSGEDIAGSSPVSLVNGVTFAPGKVDAAFGMNGASYADAGNAPSLHVSSGDFSVEAWVRFNPIYIYGSQSIVDKMSPAGPNADGWRLYAGGDRIVFCPGVGFNGCGNPAYSLISQTQLSAYVWYHVAVTVDASTMRLYLDGVLEDTVPNPGIVDSHLSNLRLGSTEGGGAYLNGQLDEVSLYDRALTAAELSAILVGCPSQDDDPPVVVIDSPQDGDVFGTTSVAMDVTISDAGAVEATSTPAGISASLPAGGGTVSGTVPLLAEGDNLLSLTVTDEFGNVGGSSVTVTRDTSSPAIDVLSPTEGAVLGSTPTTFSAQVTDLTATTLDFGANSDALPAGGGLSTGSVDLVSGSNAVTFTATDAAGNVGTAVRNVTLDLEAPLVSIDVPADGACFGPGDSPVAVLATITDLTATTVGSTPTGVSGSLPAGGGSITGAVALVEGSNTLSVSATDQTSRSSSDSIVVVLDTTAPTVVVDSPVAGAAVRGTVDFHATATEPLPGSGIAQVELLVDGAVVDTLPVAPFESSLDTTTIPDGLHTLAARATDGKGNAGTASVQVLVDNTPPTPWIDTPFDGALVGGTIAFDASASDAGSGVVSLVVSAAGQAPSPTDGSATFAPPVGSGGASSVVDTTQFADGPLVLAAEALDDAGNGAATEVTVVVDNQAPDKSLIAPADGAVVTGVVNIVADAQDPNLAQLEILVDGVSVGISVTSPLSVSYDTTQRSDGPMTITVVATDAVGNSSTCTASVTVDNVSSVDCELHPETLNLKSKGKQKSVTLEVEGSSLGLLMPTEDHAWELRVPGGSPVPSTAGFAGDDSLTDGDGDGLGELTVKFDRQLLIASIEAGIAAGMIQRDSVFIVDIYAGGAKICEDALRIVH